MPTERHPLADWLALPQKPRKADIQAATNLLRHKYSSHRHRQVKQMIDCIRVKLMQEYGYKP